MKKFLLSAFAVAVAFSAAAFQLTPQKAFTPKALNGKIEKVTKPAPKQFMKPMTKISSLDDISGSYIMLYYDYFNDYAPMYCPVTITKTATDTYKISGWWESVASDITATVDQSAGTLTIQRQEIYRYSSGSATEAADLVNLNYYFDDSSTDENLTDPLVGNIYGDGIVFEIPWGIMITEYSSDSSAIGSFFGVGIYAYLLEPNGTMTWTNSSSSTNNNVNVYIEQSNDTIYIGNFGGDGYQAMIKLNEDHSFNVPIQWVDSTSNGNWYIVGFNEDGTDLVDLNGTSTPTVLTAEANWGFYSDGGYWRGLCTPFVITRTDGGVFWEEVIPDVYILGQVGDNDWAPNVGQQMVYDADTQKYTAEIECKDADNNGYDYFAFSTKLGANADDWDGIAGYRFGAVSNGDFLVTDELLGVELSLTAPGESYQVVKGKYNLTLDYANMKLVIEKVAEPFTQGDVNGDGEVDVRDITALIDVIMNSITDNPRADVNGDNDIDVRDITALIDIIMNS